MITAPCATRAGTAAESLNRRLAASRRSARLTMYRSIRRAHRRSRGAHEDSASPVGAAARSRHAQVRAAGDIDLGHTEALDLLESTVSA